MNTYNNSVVVKFDTKVNGNAGVLAPVTVYIAGTTTKAVLFTVEGAPTDNPVFTDVTGNYSFSTNESICDLVINEGRLSEVKLLSEVMPESLDDLEDRVSVNEVDIFELQNGNINVPVAIPDVTALRLREPQYSGQSIELAGHTVFGVGGGTFVHDASDTTSADDNGVVIVTVGGARWKRVLDGFVTPEMYGVSDAPKMQVFLDTCPLEYSVKVDGDLNLDDGIVISRKLSVIAGNGTLIFNAGIEGKAALHITHDDVSVFGLKMNNPNSLGNIETGQARPYGIEIEANNVTIERCYLNQFQNSIAQRSTGEWYNTVVRNNTLNNCIGAGQGPDSPLTWGEDRGDGITFWGAGGLAIGNVIILKDGEDGRIAIHAESLPGSAPVPGPYPESSYMFTGNMIIGDWRRGVAFEGVSSGQANDNVIVGGTWHSLAIVKGAVACSMDNNTVYWNSSNASWASWGPRITPMMFYADCTSCSMNNNTVFLKSGSECMAGITMENNGDGINVDCSASHNNIHAEDDTVIISEALMTIREFGGNKALRPVLTNNTITGVAILGIEVEEATNPVITYNTIISSAAVKTVGARALQVGSCESGTIEYNHFENWEEGTFVGSNTFGTLSHNLYKDCADGISVGSTLAGLSIERNKFENVAGYKISGLGDSNNGLAKFNQGQYIYHLEQINIPTVVAGGFHVESVAVIGAAVYDATTISMNSTLGGLMLFAQATTADNVDLTFFNPTLASIGRPSIKYVIEQKQAR